MKKMHFLTGIAFLITFGNFCQPVISKIPDSLISRDYDYYIERLSNTSKFPARQKVYALAYLNKAKAERNWEETMYAYKELLHLSTAAERLVYSDSMVLAAFNAKDKTLLGSAYLTKGIVLYDQKKYTEALNNYLIANNIISKTADRYLLYKIKFNIAQLKYFVGEYGDSAILFRECIRYFEKEDKEPYINSLHSLGMCYIRLKQYALCTATNELGIKEAVKEGYGLMVSYFIHSEGINQYYLGNYDNSITKLKQIIPILKQRKDFANTTVAEFYIGKSYIGLRKTASAIPYFMKIDTAFRTRKYIREDFRESYEMLISYYKKAGNQKLELLYARRLIEADKLLDANGKSVTGKLKNGYDHKTLKEDNQTLRKLIGYKDGWMGFFIALTISVIAVLIYLLRLYHKNKKIFAGKYTELLRRKTLERQRKAENDLSDISPEVVDAVLLKLKKFEAERRYLDKSLTQVKIARRLNTNTAYISRIVYYHSGKKFTDYINDLKLNYIISLLETENRYRNYTHKALADEAHFNSTQNFVATFKKKTGISPGEYVANWRKNNREGQHVKP